MPTPTKLDYIPAVLALVMCFGLFSLLSVMAFHAVPEANRSLLDIMIGAVGTSVTAIVSFYFGSSKSSQSKDETIQKIASIPPKTGA